MDILDHTNHPDYENIISQVGADLNGYTPSCNSRGTQKITIREHRQTDRPIHKECKYIAHSICIHM